MATSPDVKNYELGKGVGYVALKDPTTGLYHGERDLGNIPALTSSVSIDYLDHFSSRSGTNKRDVHLPLTVSPTLTATLDEMTSDNHVLAYFGKKSTETQDAGYIDAEFTAELGLRTILDKREVGLYYLKYKTGTAIFAAEEVVTGAGGGVGTVISVVGDATSGTLVILWTNGISFVADEAITGSVSGAAVVDTAQTFAPGIVNVRDSTGTTTYVANTDYKVDTTLKDDKIGRIYILSTGSIVDDSTIKVRANYLETTLTVISFYDNPDYEYRFRFVSDNPWGSDGEFIVWRATISPTGDRGYISDTWSEIQIELTILDDTANHPDFPFIKMIRPND